MKFEEVWNVTRYSMIVNVTISFETIYDLVIKVYESLDWFEASN